MTEPPDDLDRLVAELDGEQRAAPAGDAPIDAWLALMAERHASDLLLLPGEPPVLRIEGRVSRTDGPVLDGVDIEDMIASILPPHALAAYRQGSVADASRRIAGLGRFRINLHRERGRAAAAIRMIPARVPTLASLELPPGSDLLSRLPRGLVIVGGATGSGKTTTVASIVDEINRRDQKHIITIEDPIEYEHANQRSVVQQVEVGVTRQTFQPRSVRRSASRPTCS